MASHAWLESSLRRSASLGLEVLERASRRSVDWTSTGESQLVPTTPGEDAGCPVKRTHAEDDDVFATLTHLMAQTTHQCKKFYESGRCAEPTEAERIHVSRFHNRHAAQMTTPALSPRKCTRSPHNKDRVSATGEDFFVEVAPGTYAVTATSMMPESQQQQQQTRLVSVNEGETIDLTFHL